MTKHLATFCAALLTASGAVAALIEPGDPTAELNGSLFFDEATTGGGDTFGGITFFAANRPFDLDGQVGAPGVGGDVTIEGVGFATNNNDSNDNVSNVTFTFIYLGADEAEGGGDDVTIGSVNVDWNQGWNGAGTYIANFGDDAPSKMIDGLGEVFRTTIFASSGGIRFKTLSGGSQPSSNMKLSASGSFAAIPEPSVITFFGVPFAAGCVLRRRSAWRDN